VLVVVGFSGSGDERGAAVAADEPGLALCEPAFFGDGEAGAVQPFVGGGIVGRRLALYKIAGLYVGDRVESCFGSFIGGL